MTCWALAAVAVAAATAAGKKDYSAAEPFTVAEKLPEARVDDLSLRQWRFRAEGLDWSLRRVFAGRDYVLSLAYPAGGAEPSAAGGALYLNDYNLCLPLGAWIPPSVGVKARAVSFAVRPGHLAGGARAWVQLRQAKWLAGDGFMKRTPLGLEGLTADAWTPVTVPVDLVPGNRLCDIAFVVQGSSADAMCAFHVADVKIHGADGSSYEAVNARPPSYLEGIDVAAAVPKAFRALPTRRLVQLGVGTWPTLVGRDELGRIGAWGEKYCPEFDVVLSVAGSPEPALRDLHARLPGNVYLQFQKAQHGRAYPALFDALPRSERGEAQDFGFNSMIATHPMIRRALDEQLVHFATLGFNNFQVYDYVWLYKGGLWGYDDASVAAYREDLLGLGERLVLTDGRTLAFADYYRAYHGVAPQPQDFGFADWSSYRPEAEAAYRADGARGARRFELFAMLRNYEWLLQAQRWNDRAAAYGGRSDYLLNGESWMNGNDHLFLLKLKNTGIVSPEYFSATPKDLARHDHALGLFVREAGRRGKRFGMTVETSRGGGCSQPYWSPRTAFAVCYALAGLGLDSFEYDHVPVCSIWRPETYRRYHPDVTDAYARATERHLIGNLRGYRRATLDGAARPDATSVLVLGRRPVSRERETVDWAATLDRLGYDYAVTDVVELPDVLDGARVVFAGDEARRPETRERLAAWQARGGGRTLVLDPDAPDLADRLAALALPRTRARGDDGTAIALRFRTRVGESAVLMDRRAVEAADRKKWYNETWAPTFHKYVADPSGYLYADAPADGACRTAFDVAANGAYRVYRYLEGREETVEVSDGTLALDNSGRFCEVYYFGPDTPPFRAFLDEVKADRALTADAFEED